MIMAAVQLDGKAITDWDTFHSISHEVFGFPDVYGRTMDAWVDCLSYLRDDDGMSKFRLKKDETLRITIADTDVLRKKAPEILDDIVFCIDAINDRYLDYGEKPALELKLT